MPKTIQIISFGHPLCEAAQRHLKQKQPDVVFKSFYRNIHLQKYHQVLTEVDAAFEFLKEQQVDLTGGTITYLALPSAGVAASVVIAKWFGLTGQMPIVLNLIRRGREGTEYVPSSELPVVNLEAVKKKNRAERQETLATGTVTF